MRQSIVHVALVVRDYDEATEFFTGKLGFTLLEDRYRRDQDKRWVVVAPPGSGPPDSTGTRPADPFGNGLCFVHRETVFTG